MNFSEADFSFLQNGLMDALCVLGIDPSQLSSTLLRRLSILAIHSPHLTSMAIAKPDLLQPWLEQSALEQRWSKRELKTMCLTRMREHPDSELALRRFHRSHLLRIAWRDLCDLDDIQIITEELSDLADVVIESVFDLVWNELILQYGEPVAAEGNSPARMAVISLGKHGGRELNFSSDVDLLFVYNFSGVTTGGTQKSIPNETFFTYLAQGICDRLSKSTAESFLYRVDNRLRPEGDQGALAVSLMMVELYYHTYGQNWERQMLLKARPVAGDSQVGKNFLSVINPFTYRKYVDEVEIAEVLRAMDKMREQSLAAIGSVQDRMNNFKNGYGGIRDIEFFVQAVQMLYGGQYPEIKLAGTLVSLQRMYESHLLHSHDYEILSSSYRFLRRIEHRLQMVDEQQVYELPCEESARRRLASSLHFKSWAEFFEQYKETTDRVRTIYMGVFHREEWQDNLDFLIEETEYSGEAESLLRYYEFGDPQRAFTFLQALNQSPDLHLQPKTTRLFKKILPRLLLCLKHSPDPDLALVNFEKLVSGFKARSALYESLCDQPPFLELLVSVTSSSSFLTRLVLRDPSLMETIGRDGFLEETITPNLLETHLRMIAQAHPGESHRDHLLRVQNAAMFRSGIRFILGLTDVERMGTELTEVAEFVLRQCLQPIRNLLQAKYSVFAETHGDAVAILGYGKLGGGEFNVASDCDLVFLYPESVIEGGVSSEEYFSRWSFQMIQYLESKSTLGFLYHPDTRLRPHGASGPQASSQSAFLAYYHSQAQFWEKMALSRARFLCGDERVRDFLESLKQDVLFSHQPMREEIQTILDMRRKIEQEKGEEKLKAGPGGLIDIEFIAQAIVLYYGSSHLAVRSTSTLKILRAAASEKLLREEDSRQLIDSYLFLRDVENRLRIVDNISLDTLPSEPDELEKLTRRYAQHLDIPKISSESFLKTILDHTQIVRTIFKQFFEDLLREIPA